MQTEKKLDLVWHNWVTGKDYEYQYFKTKFTFNQNLPIAGGYASLEIVSSRGFEASHLDSLFVDIVDERTNESFCIATNLIMGFRQVEFDAVAYNEALDKQDKDALKDE